LRSAKYPVDGVRASFVEGVEDKGGYVGRVGDEIVLPVDQRLGLGHQLPIEPALLRHFQAVQLLHCDCPDSLALPSFLLLSAIAVLFNLIKFVFY
jgi:hypothetical protein